MSSKSLLKEWQKRLCLQDWRIELATGCKPADMDIVESSGCVSWQESTKTAFIQIVDEQYYGDRVVPFDFEKTLVHELMHLKMCMLYSEKDELQERLVHQILDDLARALVDAKRYGIPKGAAGG